MRYLFLLFLFLPGCADWNVAEVDTSTHFGIQSCATGAFSPEGLTISRQAGYSGDETVTVHWVPK